MKHKDNARGFIRLFSLECLAIALSIFPLLHTHAAPHQANEKGVVQEIVESRDSAVILFGRAQNMFALLFDDFDITLLIYLKPHNLTGFPSGVHGLIMA